MRLPSTRRQASRANVVRAFRELDFGRKLKAFRINGLDTPFAYRDLIEVVEAAGDRIDVVMMPKANLPQDVRFVCMLLTQIELAKGFERPIGLEVQIESAKGFVWLREIAEAVAAPAGAHLRPRRLLGDDADAGREHRRNGRERPNLSRPSVARGDARGGRDRASERPACDRRTVRRLQGHGRPGKGRPDRTRHGL
jgi:hypothetical protein